MRSEHSLSARTHRDYSKRTAELNAEEIREYGQTDLFGEAAVVCAGVASLRGGSLSEYARQ